MYKIVISIAAISLLSTILITMHLINSKEKQDSLIENSKQHSHEALKVDSVSIDMIAPGEQPEHTEGELDDHFHPGLLKELDIEYMLEQFVHVLKEDPAVSLDYFITDEYIKYLYENTIDSEQAMEQYLDAVAKFQTLKAYKITNHKIKSLKHRNIQLELQLEDENVVVQLIAQSEKDPHTNYLYWSIASPVEQFLTEISNNPLKESH